LCLALAALALLWAGAAAADEGDGQPFDYYVLALSWSPTYCASRGREDNLQCASGRGYEFVLHGLWPQYRSGWPQFCEATGFGLSEALISDMLDIMPSRSLVRHQWNKHGTCTGLKPGSYFALARKLHDEITIPARYIDPERSIEVSVEQFVADFTATNRDLEPEMISVKCGNRRGRARLAELRICFSRAGAPVPCGPNEQRQCRAERLVLPPAR
jgi:ribonuclease T2